MAERMECVVGGRALVSRKQELFSLFRATYGRELDEATWNWHFLENPVAEPVFTLYYDGDSLLGQYAAVPVYLSIQGVQVTCYRSMTTMVHPSAQGRGIFVRTAARCYEILQDLKVPLIFGFPNTNSAPGFVRRLGWTLIEPDYIIDIKGSELIDNERLQQALFREEDVCWDVTSAVQQAWRTRTPGALIDVRQGLITKKYDGALNVLHIAHSGLAHVDRSLTYRILLDSSPDDVVERYQEVTRYHFGYRFLDDRADDVTFKRELIMSDVF